RADEGGVGDLVVGDVTDLQAAAVGVAQQHVAFAEAAEIAHARELPVQADRAHEGGAGDLIVAGIVDLHSSGVDLAHDHVAFSAARKVTQALTLPTHPTGPAPTAPRALVVAR